MKKYVLSLAVVSALLLVTTDVQAQSWKDLFNKDNIEKVVNAVTGNHGRRCRPARSHPSRSASSLGGWGRAVVLTHNTTQR